MAGVAACGGGGGGAEYPKGAQLEVVHRSKLVFNGVTVSRDGRMFLPLQREDPDHGLELAEVVAGEPRAYPDEAWNAWKRGDDAAQAFVGLNAIRIGSDGALWAVDKGSTEPEGVTVPRGPKLVRIDLASNRVTRVYPLGPHTEGRSFIDDFRFQGQHAILTEAGEKPGLLVLDLESGAVRKVLENDPSTKQRGPLLGEHRELKKKDGTRLHVQADQIEISPDGKWLYYQPCSGPMSKIELRLVLDPAAGDLAAHVLPFAKTTTTGGTAIDADGNLYVSDTNELAIWRYTPEGERSLVVRDPRLVWVDAMWIDESGALLLPAAQMNRFPGLNGGKDEIERPTVVYKLALGLRPFRN